MHKNSSGSIILVMVGMLTIVMVIATRAWLSCALLTDIALKREMAAKQYHLTQGLLNMAIASAKELLETTTVDLICPERICINPWPPQEHDQYQGTIEIVQAKEGILNCLACLQKDEKIIRTHSCKLQRISNIQHHVDQYRISHWTVTYGANVVRATC